MAASSSGSRRSVSTVVAVVMIVAAAGIVAWFGPRSSSRSPGGPQLTVAASPRATPAVRVSALPLGGLPTRVVVGSAGIDAPVAEVGVILDNGRPAWETAWHAVGHHIDSALPGQPGNVVLTGHVSVADRNNLAAFAHLDKVVTGDVVDVYSGATVYHYRVASISVVPPEAVQVLRSDQSSTVTLITCTHDLKNRLVVVGKLS